MYPFSSGRTTGSDGGDSFDEPETSVSARILEPGSFLEGHDVRADGDHAAFHDLTRELFEGRGVYDGTVGYNLARVNLDRRHPDAGSRYAVDADDRTVLRAEFSPTTEFCPQADAFVTGAFRTWNCLRSRREYDLVRVRVRSTHHQSTALDEALESLETRFVETGETSGRFCLSERRAQDTPVRTVTIRPSSHRFDRHGNRFEREPF